MTDEDGATPAPRPAASEPPWVNVPGASASPGSALEPDRATDPSAASAVPPDPAAAGQTMPPPPPASPAVPPARHPDIPLIPTARLLAASFDLLGRSGSEMRRASFYIGLIVLGTVGPVVLASFGLLVTYEGAPFGGILEPEVQTASDAVLAGLVVLAILGLVVASVESRTLAMTVLAGRMVERPVATRRALARSRQVFWSAIVASFIAGIPVVFVQSIVSSVVATTPDTIQATSVISSTVVTAMIGGPFAYVLAGVVMGGVDPFEALRRSFRVFRARKLAASIVVVFETITALLVLFGIVAGLDLVFRLFEGLGLGTEAGPVGLAATTIAAVVVTFAFGTLLFTVSAITVAPQVVMFLSLTHATIGLDRVRPGGPDDPDIPRPERRRFRWLTRSMLLGFALGAVGLALTLATVAA